VTAADDRPGGLRLLLFGPVLLRRTEREQTARGQAAEAPAAPELAPPDQPDSTEPDAGTRPPKSACGPQEPRPPRSPRPSRTGRMRDWLRRAVRELRWLGSVLIWAATWLGRGWRGLAGLPARGRPFWLSPGRLWSGLAPVRTALRRLGALLVESAPAQPRQDELRPAERRRGQPRRDQPRPGPSHLRSAVLELRPLRLLTRPLGRTPGDRTPADKTPRDRTPGERPRRDPLRIQAPATVAWLALGMVLYFCYLRLSRTVPANADGASNALQAWAMLHGNPLLRGWILSDVSFYTTELPQYMLIEMARGLTPDVMHVAGAMTYALLVLLAARLAKGSARGVAGLARVTVTIAIMAVPPQSSVSVLMLEPDHVGSAIPVLLVLLLLDRVGRRWFVPVAVFLLLTWALVADQVILTSAVGPLLIVALARAYRTVIQRRRPIRRAWFEFGLAAAAAASVPAADRVDALITAAGGFRVMPVSDALLPFAGLPHSALEVLLGVLVLFGANFAGHQVGFLAGVGLLHLAGAILVGWAVCAVVRRFGRWQMAIQVMAVAVVFGVLAYLLGSRATSSETSREFVAILPLGAALAGRVLADRMRRARLMPAVAVMLAVYAAAFFIYMTRPAAPAQNQSLATWLAGHRLYYGLGDYWMANSVTVDSGGKVAVRAITTSNAYASWPHLWEAEPSWYSPAAHLANFVALPSYGPGPWQRAPFALAMVTTFGQPAQVYLLPDYTVLVWNYNLLTRLR